MIQPDNGFKVVKNLYGINPSWASDPDYYSTCSAKNKMFKKLNILKRSNDEYTMIESLMSDIRNILVLFAMRNKTVAMTEINIKRISYLYEAVSMGTIRAAADKLNIAPSAISRQISLLESELACTLIERHRKGVTPTEAGSIVLQFYRESLSSEEACVSKLKALSGLQRGHIKLAVGDGFVGGLMLGPIPEFSRLYPELTLSISVGGSNEVIRQVEKDEAHIGLLFHPNSHPRIRSQYISYQPLCLIIAPQHPLASKDKPVQLKELLEYPVGLAENRFGVRQLLAMAEFQQKIRFNPILTTDSVAVLIDFARSNMGLTFLPYFVVSKEVKDGHLVAIPVNNSLLESGEAHIVTRLGRYLSQGPNELLNHLKLWMKSL